MYSAEVIRDIQRRLAEPGATQRGVARATGISRGTVGAVASGKRLPVETRQETLVPVNRVRCGGCGGVIEVKPCLVCRDRAEPKTPSPSLDDTATLDIELVDGDRERYLSIRGDLKRRLRRQAEMESVEREQRTEP